MCILALKMAGLVFFKKLSARVLLVSCSFNRGSCFYSPAPLVAMSTSLHF